MRAPGEPTLSRDGLTVDRWRLLADPRAAGRAEVSSGGQLGPALGAVRHYGGERLAAAHAEPGPGRVSGLAVCAHRPGRGCGRLTSGRLRGWRRTTWLRAGRRLAVGGRRLLLGVLL